MTDLSGRLSGRIQLTTDGHGAYPNAVGLAFRHNIDFAQLVKLYTDRRGDREAGRLMHGLTGDREQEVDRLIELVARWSSGRPDLRGAALVGSWVTRSAQMDSDVDVILLTDYPLAYIESDAGARDLGASAIIRTRGWGSLTERRLAMPTGLQVDVGLLVVVSGSDAAHAARVSG